MAPVPAGPADRSPAIAVHGLGIPVGAPNAEPSFQLIQWATSEEVWAKIAISEPYPDFTRASVAANAVVIVKYLWLSLMTPTFSPIYDFLRFSASPCCPF